MEKGDRKGIYCHNDVSQDRPKEPSPWSCQYLYLTKQGKLPGIIQQINYIYLN